METPSSQIKRLFKESNERQKEIFKYIFEKSDSITLWIIGLSVGGIAIIANDLGSLKASIPSKYMSPILVCLVTSVITGITYRISCLWLFLYNSQSSIGIDLEFTEHKVMHTQSLLTGEEDYAKLVFMIKTGFGYDYSPFIERYEQSDEIDKKRLYFELEDIYKRNVEFAKKDAEYGMQEAIEVFAKYTGQSVEKIKKSFEKTDIGRKLHINIIILYCLSLIFYLSFFATLILFALSA